MLVDYLIPADRTAFLSLSAQLTGMRIDRAERGFSFNAEEDARYAGLCAALHPLTVKAELMLCLAAAAAADGYAYTLQGVEAWAQAEGASAPWNHGLSEAAVDLFYATFAFDSKSHEFVGLK